MSNSGTDVAERTKVQIDEPSWWRVIYMNDDKTSMEFVMESLVEVFDYTLDEAHEMTMRIHTEGHGIVAVLPYEIAEQKGMEVKSAAEAEGYPLVVRIEPDD